MTTCANCGVTFRGRYELTRHMSRKTPCVKVKIGENKAESEHIYTREGLTGTVEPGFNSLECTYCKYLFTDKGNARRHESSKNCCKEDRKIRSMEIKLRIPYDRYHEKDCRFCKKVFVRRETMIRHQKKCQKLAEYREALQDKFNVENTKTVNNVTINNITNHITNNNNNIVINSVNRTDRIMRHLPEKIARWLLYDQRQNSGRHMEWRTGVNMILDTHQEPQNRNLKVTSDRSGVIYCYDGETDIPEQADTVIEDELQKCLEDLVHIRNTHDQVLSKIGVVREIESYIDTIATQAHAQKHKRSIMTGLFCQSVKP